MAWHTSYGKIYYDPLRPGLKNRKDWWAVVSVDREITRYYRWLVLWGWGVKLNQPSWDAHISIIRGEKPSKSKIHLWKKYQGKKIGFKYSNLVRPAKKSNFWIVEIDCPFLVEIRKEFEFPSNWKLHLTIGKEKE